MLSTWPIYNSMERGHHPYQVDVSSPNPKTGPLPGRHGSVARAATSTLQGNDAAFQAGNVPPVLPKPQVNDVTATKEKASSGSMSNAIQKPVTKNDNSHKELPAAKTSENVPNSEDAVINASNKAICDVIAARSQAAATEVINKAMEQAEKIKKEAELKASQAIDEAHARAQKADEEVAKIKEDSLRRCYKVLETARGDNARAERDMEEVRHQARAGAKKARKVLHDAGEATAMLRGIKDILEAYLSGVAAQHALDELHEQPAPPGQ